MYKFLGFALFLILLSHEAQPIESQLVEQSNEIVYVDLLSKQNLERHHTASYDPYGANIVLRRGEPFNIVAHLRNVFNQTNDKIRLEFSFGANPKLEIGTLVYLPVLVDRKTFINDSLTKWDARVVRVDDKQIGIEVNLPPTMPIGYWRFKISTKLAGSKNLVTFSVRESLSIIFNPWNENDDVYMPNENERVEYVLNDVGKIYVGSYAYPVGRKWTYGQFDQSVLSSVFHLLDKTRLDAVSRANAVKVSRAVSALVNSHDDNGLLVGNWSGSYGDGLAPWQWKGSAGVFRRYLQNGYRPVKFGQCWVFGGVTTTTLRTLGIPARTISNFVSAHDTDFSLTVDKFFSETGRQMENINGDSIWNFHVWSDAWMARNDLPPGYGGWQAIDATPQERSMGMYQLGPASLEAIKQGRVGFAYDVGFVYSEVNADVVYWRLDERARLRWTKTRIQPDHVGRKILTKKIGVLDEWSRSGTSDAENIVYQYKHVEGSSEAQAAHAEAAKAAGLLPMIS